MKSISYVDFSNDLDNQIDNVVQNNQPLLVTRKNSAPVVIVSFDYFKPYEETAYLMTSQNNTERLNNAVTELSKINPVIK